MANEIDYIENMQWKGFDELQRKTEGNTGRDELN